MATVIVAPGKTAPGCQVIRIDPRTLRKTVLAHIDRLHANGRTKRMPPDRYPSSVVQELVVTTSQGYSFTGNERRRSE